MTNNVDSPKELVQRSGDHVPNGRQVPYLLFVLLISILALAVLTADTLIDRRTETGRILHYADTFLCALFLFDFLVCFKKSENKLKYMLSWGWLDLLSSIPAIDALRWGRAARLMRVLRVLRGVRSARILMRFILEKRAQSAGMTATLSSIVVIALASIAVLHFEQSAGDTANIRSADDALWWSFVTITTVGYGDHFPVTTEGRLVAVGLMLVGVGLIGTWAGIAASWFLAPEEIRQEHDLKALRREIQELRRIVEEKR